ncbi:MAG: porin family protein [Bacteroidota bacterium]|nr:porin family protein [Bacteroidota bacterium]
MRKILCMIAALFVAFTVSAQLSVRGGLSLSNMIGEDAEDLDPKVGFIAGLGYDLEFAQGVAFQTGLYALTKGYKWEDAVTSNAIYLQVPLHVAAKIDFTPGTRIVIHGGPFVAYGIAGKTKALVSVDTFGEDGAKRFDAGFGLGVGTELGRLLFDLGVDMGLLSPYENIKKKNMSAYLTVGFRF